MNLAGTEVRKVERCGSTNTVLLDEGKPGVLLIADEQTAGRGRRGRRWYSAPGADIAFSLSAEVAKPPPGLSLVAGVAAARALRALGVAQAALKWPNDLLVGGAKLGGILVETLPARCRARGAIAATDRFARSVHRARPRARH